MMNSNTQTFVRMYTSASCPFCVRAEHLLIERGVQNIEKIRVDLDSSQKEKMMAETGRRTVPQIYIGSLHVGGCDDLLELDRAGKLLPLLNQAT
jgi:glutaredoxin 3